MQQSGENDLELFQAKNRMSPTGFWDKAEQVYTVHYI